MWLVRLPCSKAEADALDVAAEGFGEGDDSPTLTAVLMEEPRPERWYLEAFCPQKPDADLIARLRKLTRSRAEAVIEKLPDQDWVSLSQQGAGPIRIGRFFIHSQHHEQASPAGSYPIQIEAAQAFGTGSHATTQGCLALLERLARRQRPQRILDLGTGSGILAFGAARLWRRARILASDSDPVAVDTARDFARANHLAHRVQLLTATGLDHLLLRAAAPYDLLIANILAAPLISLAPRITPAVRHGGWLLLAGLLDTQEQAVRGAYVSRGFIPEARLQIGDWPSLLLRRK